MLILLVIASLVQLVEMVIQKTSPVLYQSLGIFLPPITTTCAVLGVAVLNIQKDYSFVESLEAMYPFYFVRFLGGALFLCGMLVMAYNVVKTVSGARPVDAPVPQTA